MIWITEKMALTTGPNNGKPERVCDLVRGAIEVTNFTTMMNVLRLLCDLDLELGTTGETGGILEKIVITRSKCRFSCPTSGGWADIMVNFYFASDGRRHICELQLVHTQLYTIRKNMGAHATYAVFRAAMELLRMVGEDSEEGSDQREVEALLWAEESGLALTDRGEAQGSASTEGKLDDLEKLLLKISSQNEKLELQNKELKRQMVQQNEKLESQNEELRRQLDLVLKSQVGIANFLNAQSGVVDLNIGDVKDSALQSSNLALKSTVLNAAL